MVNRLHIINEILSAQYKALKDIREKTPSSAVCIISRIGDGYDGFNLVKTGTPNMQAVFTYRELKDLAENYCATECCAEQPLTECCGGCALYEFMKGIEARSEEEPPEPEEEEEEEND